MSLKNKPKVGFLAQTVGGNQLGQIFSCRMNLEMHSWHDFRKNVKIVKNGPKMTLERLQIDTKTTPERFQIDPKMTPKPPRNEPQHDPKPTPT